MSESASASLPLTPAYSSKISDFPVIPRLSSTTDKTYQVAILILLAVAITGIVLGGTIFGKVTELKEWAGIVAFSVSSVALSTLLFIALKGKKQSLHPHTTGALTLTASYPIPSKTAAASPVLLSAFKHVPSVRAPPIFLVNSPQDKTFHIAVLERESSRNANLQIAATNCHVLAHFVLETRQLATINVQHQYTMLKSVVVSEKLKDTNRILSLNLPLEMLRDAYDEPSILVRVMNVWIQALSNLAHRKGLTHDERGEAAKAFIASDLWKISYNLKAFYDEQILKITQHRQGASIHRQNLNALKSKMDELSREDLDVHAPEETLDQVLSKLSFTETTDIERPVRYQYRSNINLRPLKVKHHKHVIMDDYLPFFGERLARLRKEVSLKIQLRNKEPQKDLAEKKPQKDLTERVVKSSKKISYEEEIFKFRTYCIFVANPTIQEIEARVLGLFRNDERKLLNAIFLDGVIPFMPRVLIDIIAEY